MTTAPHVPAPPPGPGVQPPFPAPPVEGRGRRIGLGLGVGAGVLLLVCGGGLAALIGLGTSMQAALEERAHAAVTGYLDALRDRRYDQAYGLLCDRAKREESRTEFRQRVTADEQISSYRLGGLNTINLSVPVSATYADGDAAELDAFLGQDTGTGAFEVCELAE
jgi:hypothetical protein